MTYKEKAKMVMMLNKRMRDIINKTGFNTQEFAYWQNRISGGVYKSIETTTAYTADDQEYNLISRRKADIEKYTDEEKAQIKDLFQKVVDLNAILDKYDIDVKLDWEDYLSAYSLYFDMMLYL